MTTLPSKHMDNRNSVSPELIVAGEVTTTLDYAHFSINTGMQWRFLVGVASVIGQFFKRSCRRIPQLTDIEIT